MEQMAWNPILRQYLISAPHRMNRREGSSACPFCEDIAGGKVGPDTQVWLHPNDFPPFQPPVGEAYQKCGVSAPGFRQGGETPPARRRYYPFDISLPNCYN
jgi:hypothetical protein